MIDPELTKQIELKDLPFFLHTDNAHMVAALSKKPKSAWIDDAERFERILVGIRSSGVTAFDPNALREKMAQILEEKGPCVFANGTPPVHGRDGYIQYHFVTNPAEEIWQEDDSERIDFRQRQEINNVSEGALLAERIDPTPHRDGVNLSGDIVKARVGRAIRLHGGKNVNLNFEETQAFSAIDGAVKLVKNKINVDTIITIKGDVDFRSGNIEYNGDVIIQGDINETFVVKATGSVKVGGLVDRGEIVAGGDIAIMGGIYGRDDVKVHAGGNVSFGFAENAKIIADGNVYARGAVVNCEISTSGKLHLKAVGKSLIGGYVRAAYGVDANTLGSPRMPAPTIIEFGTTPEMAQQMRTLSAEYQRANDTQKEALAKQIIALKPEYDRQRSARVTARHVTYPGVKFIFEKASYEVKSEIGRMIFYKLGTKNEILMRGFQTRPEEE
jgi:uncharacterized protein (DUF342 family)